MKFLTFAFDAELDNDQFIDAGTVVEVYREHPERGYTDVIVNGEIIGFQNTAFVEYK